MATQEAWAPVGFDIEVETGRGGPVTLAEAELQLGVVLAGVLARVRSQQELPVAS